MFFKTSNKGLTLIEILIAIIVLMVGLVGVLALFPTGIKSTKETAEDSNTAVLADSVSQALQAAMRMPSVDTIQGIETTKVRMSHDGLPLYKDSAIGGGSQECVYTFRLPEYQNSPPPKPRIYAHPDSAEPKSVPSGNQFPTIGELLTNETHEPKWAFRLGNSPSLSKTFREVIGGQDSTDPYNQYAYAFTIMRLDDLEPNAIDPNTKINKRLAKSFYEFKIYIYRLPAVAIGYDLKIEDVTNRTPLKVFTVQLSGL